MKKKISLLALAAGLAAITGLTGCASTESAAAEGGAEVTVLRYQGSANNVSLPELAEHLGYLNGITLDWVGNTISGPQDIQS